jgi:hypothetical protein
MFVLTVGMVILTSSVAIVVIIIGLRSPKLSTYETPPRDQGAVRATAMARESDDRQ